MEIRDMIIRGGLDLFRGQGIHFTMEDLAHHLGISKKTIYTVFRSKEELALAMADTLFDGIKESEAAVMSDQSLSTPEKIRQILGAMPESYQSLDFGQLDILQEKYPAVYRKVSQRLETGWDDTIRLIEKGIEEGSVRNVKIPVIKAMFEASLEHFFQRNVLADMGISYQEALNDVVDILMEGILTR